MVNPCSKKKKIQIKKNVLFFEIVRPFSSTIFHTPFFLARFFSRAVVARHFSRAAFCGPFLARLFACVVFFARHFWRAKCFVKCKEKYSNFEYTTSVKGFFATFFSLSKPNFMFRITVLAQYKLTIRQTVNNFDSLHQLSYGPNCPGNTVVQCSDYSVTFFLFFATEN